jgi:hypothetical protein
VLTLVRIHNADFVRTPYSLVQGDEYFGGLSSQVIKSRKQYVL